MCVNADRTGPLAPLFSQMSVMWKITIHVLLQICNQNVKWESAFWGGVSVCVNADRTGPLTPPFITNECHVENYYNCGCIINICK